MSICQLIQATAYLPLYTNNIYTYFSKKYIYKLVQQWSSYWSRTNTRSDTHWWQRQHYHNTYLHARNSDLRRCTTAYRITQLYLARSPSGWKQARRQRAICSASVSSFIFNDSCQTQTNYLKSTGPNFAKIFRPGRNMTVDYQSEISFSILQGTLSWQPTVVGLIYITDFRHASG